jgi:hypothetical protein
MMNANLFGRVPQKNATEFDKWWEHYPHKVAKGAARRAFRQALRSASLDELVAGVERYRRNKPKDIAYCNPATWLNDERWLDRPAHAGNEMNGHPAMVFYSVDSPQYKAWKAVLGDKVGRYRNPRNTSELGWLFESEWPPSFSPPDAG